MDWDEPISATESAKWEKWKAKLSELASVEIPRCYLSSTTNVLWSPRSSVVRDIFVCNFRLCVLSLISTPGLGWFRSNLVSKDF
jgi:hypothetical protein